MTAESDAQPVPDELAAALSADAAGSRRWAALRPSCRREYLSWVGEAKRPETRRRRAASVLDRMASDAADA